MIAKSKFKVEQNFFFNQYILELEFLAIKNLNMEQFALSVLDKFEIFSFKTSEFDKGVAIKLVLLCGFDQQSLDVDFELEHYKIKQIL